MILMFLAALATLWITLTIQSWRFRSTELNGRWLRAQD